ncbi:alpha-1,2-fucosyltransferase [Butyrivibrio fibrisolvens]|uniref:alpha-1,2-fucosyltransferase n=1 Tax=Butyrivibrio fibrisolvens TaxID=831 RepID=UPI0003B76B17|nr:alpha-1,2-fucosyltransferase [Butyrivibrio fibrisolvens]
MIVRYTGGLGNQLFQYAFGKAYAKKYGCDLKFDDFSYIRDRKRKLEIDALNICRNDNINIGCKIFFNVLFYLKRTDWKIFLNENNSLPYEMLDGHFKSKYFIGYWQDVRYFRSIRSELQEEFRVKSIPERISNIYNEINNSPCTVAIHVRRGDYQQIPEYIVQDRGYFIKAIEYMKLRLENPIFYIFSDDPEWCSENLLNIDVDKVVVRGYSAIEDFALMRACKNYIISNSTFSWWPAFLSDSSIKIAPDRWYTDEIKNERVRKSLLDDFIIL